MAEVAVSVAAKLAEYLVDPTLQQLQYLFCVGKITRNVEVRKWELILTQGKVQERVQEAINKTERIDGEVNKWKSDVKNLIAELDKLEEKLKANNGCCFRRWCPTWRRYCLCKELAKITQRMVELNMESDNFNPFSHPTIIPGIEYHSSPNFTFFNSTQRAFDDLLKALKDDGNSIIGLWGMGGSGKTTLVTEVGKEAKESKLFDRVVKTTISQNLEIRKVQGEIADMLGLKLEEESDIGRAKRLALRLQRGERILIILDDVWAKLNLEDIGIPFGGNDQRNCKIVLTTRRQDVCTLMNCGNNVIQLGMLEEDEAWELFQTHANVDGGAKEVVAREVAKECKGLPIAIVAVGTCLKAKGLDEMEVVLHKLKHSKPIDHEDKSVRDAFACLELSYSYLKSKEAKSLFLMCAMFPEDHKIVIEDLFRYGIGLGLCEDAESFAIVRSQVTTAIGVLIDSSLLMYSLNLKGEKCVKMHDMVRDVALWISSNMKGTIKVNYAKELNGFLDDDVVKDCYAVSSWYHQWKSLEFPSQLNAPKLDILLLHSTSSLDLSHASFEGAKGLKVVAIISKGYSHFSRLPSLMVKPQSIQQLSNLRTLRLRGWYLGDISFVVSLTRLEILDLQGSKFEKLPNGIE
ncbi:probable disease resistance protein At4g27220 [Prosopis cineraria]|uniref:probable disease resistance protein At4g27220 n=1 Tax=Prosopis cineraria TaxID=364024 RepID=UPI00240EEEEA|nr:probable disease resistance protein At4g27220 [Prosopis cineraria]